MITFDSLPAGWQVRKLRHLAGLRFSNVDKHTKPGEVPVRLCNYTDVYYQSEITEQLDFMWATATRDEIERFGLRAGDVLATKDSETPDDIAVPAYVPADLPGVVCGYHLAQLRPRAEVLNSKYLYYAFCTHGIRDQFFVAANGVTRFGLSKDAFKDVVFPVPPRPEQDAIIVFLDRKLEQIDRYLATKRHVAELGQELRAGIIERLVLRGAKPSEMRFARLGWLGQIPSHWDERAAKYFMREIDERSRTGCEELLSVSHITGVTPRSQKTVTMFMAESYVGSKLCNPGDLVINTMWAWMAALGVARQEGIVSPSYAVYRQNRDACFVPDYLDHLLRVKPYAAEYKVRSTGIRDSRLRLYPDKFLSIPLICPPKDEQGAICARIEEESANARRLIERTEREIEKMTEYRTCLIAEAVCGRLDIRRVS